MITFIAGGVRSGKSNFAEELIKQEHNKIYLATALNKDKEMEERIKHHQITRSEDGYKTIEQPFNLGEIMNRVNENDVVLLDCLTNLLANEMYVNGNDDMSQILGDLFNLETRVKHLVIVSNDVFSSGIEYDTSVKKYMKSLGYLHQLIIQNALDAYELIYNIPLKRK